VAPIVCQGLPDSIKPETGNAMKQLFTRFSIVSALAFVSLAVGCASTEQTETLLSEAGFRTVITTGLPQRQLRPYKVTVTEANGESYYAYADPARNQVYVGNRSQYQRYRQLKRELEAAQQSYNPPVYD
jgi:hypothetical protein